MASPAEFVRQVKQEASKVTWPSRKEVGIIAIMVFVVVAIFTLFFGVVDFVISTGVSKLLGI
jgi:preprotein translocase subunit SecE